MSRLPLAALAVAALVGVTSVGVAVIPGSAFADRSDARQSFMPSRHLDGRIAYLKTELKITDAQAPLWDKVAQTMRDNAKTMDGIVAAARRDPNAPPPTAIDRLQTRAKFAQARAQGSERLLAAFQPLYASMSDDQKKAADDLLGGGGRRHRH